jgi:hypothetical protein
MPITRSPCCATSLENRFPAWLSAVGGREHLWMRDNLEVSLTANLGTSSMLDTDHLAVRVARIDAFSRLFTWAQKLDHTCPSYGEEVVLVIFVVECDALATAPTANRGRPVRD